MNLRLLRLWLGVCGVAATLLFASTLIEIPVRSALRGYDNTFNYLWLRSAMVDGDWDFRNDLEACDTLVPEQRTSALGLKPTATGRIPNKYGVGWAVVSLPFYLAADAVVGLARALGATSLVRDGFNPVYQIGLQVGHLFLALASLWLAWRTIAGWLGGAAFGTAAAAGVTLVWAASPLLYYQTVNLSMSHGTAFFAIALFGYTLVRAREKDRLVWWMLSGAAWGLAVVTRFPLGVFGVVALWALAQRASIRSAIASRFSGTLRAAAAFCLGAAPLLALQFWAWRVVYGEWFVFSYGEEGETFHWGRPEIANSLFSAWHGLFYWHPFLLVAAAGTAMWVWRARREAAGWGVALLLIAYVNAAWWCWWFASAFGNRGYDAALLPLMAGTAWLLLRTDARWRTALWTVGITAGLWNIYLALLYRTGAISRQSPVTWSEMLAALAALPEAMRF